ncbi:hypothetical protein G9A89_001869 [Geosiphon pyriformis]|nr:hypothetical protein G9A89_001869 [Geosiphon pyriformis]
MDTPSTLHLCIFHTFGRNSCNSSITHFYYFPARFRSIYGGQLCAYRWTLASRSEHWDVAVNHLYCQSSNKERDWLAFLIPSIFVAAVGSALTCHSSILLFTQWRVFRRNQNRRTAIQLGHALRLQVCSILYIILIYASLVPPLIQKIEEIPSKEEILTPSQYSHSFSGIFLFLVFGTTRSVALFLPCCYYSQPNPKLPQNNLLLIETVINNRLDLEKASGMIEPMKPLFIPEMNEKEIGIETFYSDMMTLQGFNSVSEGSETGLNSKLSLDTQIDYSINILDNG